MTLPLVTFSSPVIYIPKQALLILSHTYGTITSHFIEQVTEHVNLLSATDAHMYIITYAGIFLYKPWRPNGLFQFEIIINVLVSSFRFIQIMGLWSL